ncbi:MAG: hypothetical protein ACRC1T_04775, partial [Clostridium chrysemydis]|uniref:hypothetical protein n=1 Tax=Clostridium chrysemydis TaxID=2665504 RepID=UPI003F2C5862
RVFKNGYRINENFYLGQNVMCNGIKRTIIGFGISVKDKVILTGGITGDRPLNSSLFATHILEGYENEIYWEWCDISDFRTIEDKKERSINLTFDTKELQEKLEKAVYHLKEFNSILDDLNTNGVNIKMRRD